MDTRLLRQKKRQQRLKRRRIVFYIGMSFLCLVLLFGTAGYVFLNSLQPADANDPGKNQAVQPPEHKKGERLNILLLGVDEGRTENNRTDTMILASLNTESKQLSLISIPRDSRVEIPTRPGLDKINHAHAYGGPNLAMKAVEKLLDLPVHHYVRISFDGFEGLIDALGGIEVNVEKNMYYPDPYQDLLIDIKAGRQKLNGKKALQYVRYRDDEGDMGRVKRQQNFMNALADEVLSPSTIVKIIPLMDKMSKLVDTDMNPTEILKYANLARQINRDEMTTHTIPGTDAWIDKISYWIPDREGVKKLVAELESEDNQGTNGQEIINKETEPIQVRVLNGSGKAGIAAKAADSLKAKGYEVIEVDNADRFDYQYTQIVNYGKDKAEAKEIAKIVKSKELITGNGDNKGADITVILGKDYTD
jgi:LCP family protein required for cell wall assembly